jgi:hypothetical protein
MATVITPWGKPQAAIVAANPAAPAAAPAMPAPQPAVIAQAVKIAAAQPPVILRNTLADAPVLTTPAPVVITALVRWPPTFPVISSAPFIPPPPPFTAGTLTACSAPGSALTASDAPGGVLTAAVMATGGPS